VHDVAATSQLEEALNDLFVKSAPSLPEKFKKFLVDIAPWLTLLAGVLVLWSALALWRWAHVANNAINTLNSIANVYGVETGISSRMTFGVWLGVGVLLVEGILYLMAFKGLRDRVKAGWDLLFYAALLNVAYGIVLLFTDRGGAGSLVGTVIGTAIGLYFLFQVRSHYSAKVAMKAE